MTQDGRDAAPDASGTWLLFDLGGTAYGVDVARVRQIIGLPPITRVPRMPPAVRGVINLRGTVLPVVDLRIRFGLETADHGQRTCVIVLRAAGAEFGAVVDRVLEVARIDAAATEPAPQFGTAIDAEYLLGVAQHGGRVVLLMDPDHAVPPRALAALSADAEGAA